MPRKERVREAQTKPLTRKTKKTASQETEAPSRKRVTFSLNSPKAHQAELAGDFTAWNPVAMKKGTKGHWQKIMVLSPGRHQYRFVVDGRWIDDPQCAERADNQMGSQNCVIKV